MALAMLAGDYASRRALLRAAGGTDMAARLTALLREQQQAEQALTAQLAAQVAQRATLTPPSRPGGVRRGRLAHRLLHQPK